MGDGVNLTLREVVLGTDEDLGGGGTPASDSCPPPDMSPTPATQGIPGRC